MSNTKDTFLFIGKNRIRLSNIKTYGISSKVFYYQKVYRATVESMIIFFNHSFSWEGDTILLNKEKQDRIKKLNPTMEHDALEVKNTGSFEKLIIDEDGEMHQAAEYMRTYNLSDNWHPEPGDIFGKKQKYLYITTFQNENYRFYESEVNFDIEEKCKEIDEMFR